MPPFVFPKMPRVNNFAANAIQGMSTIGRGVVNGAKWASNPKNLVGPAIEGAEAARNVGWAAFTTRAGLFGAGVGAAYMTAKGIWRGGSGEVARPVQTRTQERLASRTSSAAWGITGLK